MTASATTTRTRVQANRRRILDLAAAELARNLLDIGGLPLAHW